jgi:hypothetical protein
LASGPPSPCARTGDAAHGAGACLDRTSERIFQPVVQDPGEGGWPPLKLEG